MVRTQSPDSKVINLIDVHFFSLPSQGNVYTLASLTDAKGYTKLLVASLQRKIHCLEYRNGKPCMREVPFTYIPAGAEIISVDAVNRSVIQEDFIIGITIIKKEDGKTQPSQFFNIYSDWDLNSDSALEVVSQNCLTLNLDFVPYHLYHTQARTTNGWETVWLLSGSDQRIHVYHPDDESYQEESDTHPPSFPEFSNLSQITLQMDISYSCDKKRRVSVVGGEGGRMEVFTVTVDPLPNVTASRVVSWDYPVAAVRTFALHKTMPLPSFLRAFVPQYRQSKERDPDHLAVCSTLESCFVYRDFLGSGGQSCMLPESSVHDAVLCCEVCDIDHDGRNEVLLGTYGQVVLIYKWIRENKKEEEEEEEEKEERGTTKEREDEEDKEREKENEKERQQNNGDEAAGGGSWDLYHTLKLPCPVLALSSCDVTGDGCYEVVVMTTAGIHIFRHDPRDMAGLVLKRLKTLTTQHVKTPSLEI